MTSPGVARRRRRRSAKPGRRPMYVLPNLVTTAALMLGFWSIVSAIHGSWDQAALGIVLAGVCDMLDGRIARATRSTSRFGVQYDSLADVISFGLAPALLVYNWALAPLGRRGWVIASLFAVCAALRLARFNVQTETGPGPKVHNVGLPTTTAGGMVAVSVWFVGWLEMAPPFPRPAGVGLAAGFVLLALLMVSSVPYPSWKSLPMSGRNAFPTLLLLILGLVLLLLYQAPAFFALGVIYTLSGPVLWLLIRRRAPAVLEPTPESGDAHVRESDAR